MAKEFVEMEEKKVIHAKSQIKTRDTRIRTYTERILKLEGWLKEISKGAGIDLPAEYKPL